MARFAGCLLLSILGCAGAKPPAALFDSLPVRSLAPDELVARVNHDAAAVSALKGKLEIGMRVPPEDSFKRCRGVIASRSPWGGGEAPGLYMEGHRQLVPTLFTLTSDGHEFWLYIPYDNVAYTGPVDGTHPARHGQEIRIDVNDLFRALFVAPVGPDDSLAVSEDGSDYVVALSHNGRLQRRLWVERRGLTVRREVYCDPQGAVRLQIERESYADCGGSPYPMRLVLRDLANGSTLSLEFGSITLQPDKLDDRIFRPKLPRGTVVHRAELQEAKQ